VKIACPACSARFSLDAGVNDDDARKLSALLAGLPPTVARPLVQYLALFRPEKTGLRWSRALAFAVELAPMILSATVVRDRKEYRAPLEAWAAAMQHLVDRPKTVRFPLKSNGYLLEMIASGAERVEAKTEAVREKSKRTPTRKGSGAPVAMRDMVNKYKKQGGSTSE